LATKIDGVKLEETFTVTEYAPEPVVRANSVDGCNTWKCLHVWCKGVTIDAAVNVTEFEPADGCSYEVGFVQVLEFSRMKAIYADKAVKEWLQETLPCYDSTDDGCIPWYTADATSHAPITGTGQINLQLRDYPTSFIDPYLNHPIPTKSGPPNNGPHPLTYYTKHNKFNVYLMVRRTKGGEVKNTYLQHCRWSTKVELEPKDEVIGTDAMYRAGGYKTVNHDLSKSWVYAVITAYFHSLPDVSAASANNHIQDEAPRRERHPLPFLLKWK
jgi:hypothetical protein